MRQTAKENTFISQGMKIWKTPLFDKNVRKAGFVLTLTVKDISSFFHLMLPQSSLLPKFVRRIDAYGGFHYQASSHFFIVTSPISIKISVPLFV